MKISRKSWHYRYLNRFGCIDVVDNLCLYVSLLVFLLVFPPMVVALLLISLTMVAIAVVENWLFFTVAAGTMVLPIGTAIAWGKLKSKSPIIGEWLKAKKRKVCPIIEFHD